jgi:hypothetical protein
MSAPPTSRVGRYPRHPFSVQQIPMHIQPFCIAPVLPGETLDNLYFESRAVSAPVKNSLIGWKLEYYYFYVRITDLLQDTIRDMFVDPTNTDLSATLGIAATDRHYYTAKGGIDYMKRGVRRIVDEWFRDEGDSYDTWKTVVNGSDLYVAPIKELLWMDSLTDKDDLPMGTDPGVVSTAGDLEALMQAFEQLRALGIANMTYEDWLRTNGIAIPRKDENAPELLAKFTDFQYPSNTIDPLTGNPSSALSWVFKNGSKDKKFFKEPGFIIGLTIARPKLYFSGPFGSLTGFLSRAWDWLPNYLWDLEGQASTSLKKFAGGTGPLGDLTSTTGENAYWVDMRDLFLHGDQYQNRYPHTDGTTPSYDGNFNLVPLPANQDSIATRQYVTKTMMDALFDGAESAQGVCQDGYVSFNIKGHQVDYTESHQVAGDI